MGVLVRKKDEVERIKQERRLLKTNNDLEEGQWEKHWMKDKSETESTSFRRLGGGRRPRPFVSKTND